MTTHQHNSPETEEDAVIAHDRRRYLARKRTLGAVVAPEDGLHQGLEQLKAKLGPSKFLDMLLAAIPPKH